MFKRLFLFIVVLFAVEAVFSQPFVIKFVLGDIPDGGTSDKIFLAGSMSGWQPSNEDYLFRQDEHGQWAMQTILPEGEYQYKLTKGSWEIVETDTKGQDIANRILVVKKDTTIFINIAAWKTGFSNIKKQSTASPQVGIETDSFYIPQLDRYRRIWVYLPKEYPTTLHKYPVVYMHDGQNLFEDSTSYSGEWGVDEFLDTIRGQSYIVVGIDNGGDKRLNEYNPYSNEQFGKGEGDLYVDFLAKTLKPFIDKKYRTKENNSIVIGSSMGGLISLHAILKYPKLFKKAGVFSPAFWVAPEFLNAATNSTKQNRCIYFYAGGKESESMVEDMKEVVATLKKKQKRKLRYTVSINENAQHNEAAWRSELPAFFYWLNEF